MVRVTGLALKVTERGGFIRAESVAGVRSGVVSAVAAVDSAWSAIFAKTAVCVVLDRGSCGADKKLEGDYNEL